MSPIIIVGTGLAGYTLAREWRKLDKETPLVMITSDNGSFYSKPMLSNAFASGKTPAALATQDVTQMQTQLNAEIRSHSTVDGIDASKHTVTVNGEMLAYSKLVLALGADTINPGLSGNAADKVFSVNDLADYARFREAIEGKKRVAILGAGLIGCEFANDLAGAGYAVEVIHLAAQPLDRLLPAEASQAVRQALEKLGVVWHFNKKAVTVDHTDQGYRVTLSDGSIVEADVVLSAIGLRPRVAMAQAAGITINRGIVTNRLMETSAPDVYALGDCAEVAGHVLPFVLPLMQGARALAQTLSGNVVEVSYPAMPVAVKTPACTVSVCPPPFGAEGNWQVTCDDEGVCALFYGAENQLLGFALTGKATAQKGALGKQLPPVLG
ncbi:NAD(P)/FAD-dependent oxidoreductase [Sulfurirhabdus autotrophica]|uniref:Rubredoxin-NAD+ reductase n=1 Tax=Sulfurirhabdus autotrophica TaxID=1706046 RepID=A0A4R3XVW2_9PROT|nr:FAD-dependent oxidoreductase [Sulfurirhabdus autotrophica]TCV80223.1 rubredoxin-NAD+ reductase [Sulfurirhabdus autotrophica]